MEVKINKEIRSYKKTTGRNQLSLIKHGCVRYINKQYLTTIRSIPSPTDNAQPQWQPYSRFLQQ